MTCGACSVEVADEARFCHNCGSPVQGESASPALFDATRLASTPEEAERIAWEILEPHLKEAKDRSSTKHLLSAEWAARLLTRRPKGPVPELHAQTPFFSIVYSLILGREQYEDTSLLALEELARSYGLRISLMDNFPFDVETWKVVIDPDGLRIKPTSHSPSHFEQMGDKYYHSVTWNFDAAKVSEVAGPITVALIRLPFDELRYEFRDSMR